MCKISTNNIHLNQFPQWPPPPPPPLGRGQPDACRVICSPCPMIPGSTWSTLPCVIYMSPPPRVICSPGPKCSTDSMFPMLYVPSCPMFTHVLCIVSYVHHVLCSLLSYVSRVLCYPGPNFPGCYGSPPPPPPLSNVPLILCSPCSM